MESEARIDAPCGVVLSQVHGGVLRARGIAYASARRFAPPEPLPRWTEPLPALEESPACPQPDSPLLEKMFGVGWVATQQDEDCQRLTVTAPNDIHDGQLPVMVWIHGGSYTSGSGDARLMDPAPLVEEQQVIVVTVTYRLGILGYLGDGATRPANLGLLDQIAALHWVQENIGAFGGDPDNVTIFGQSAGADAVAHLMTLPEAPRLFRRAIIQSAPSRSPQREKIAEAMVAATTGLCADAPLSEVFAAQREAEQAASAFGLAASMPFGVQYGHEPLPSWAECEHAWARNAPAIDLLIGYTADEARFFLPALPGLDRAARLPLIGRALRWTASWSLTQVIYTRSARRFARAHAAAGGRGWSYRIDWPGNAGPYGAAHTIDLPLLFGRAEDWHGTGLLQGLSATQIRDAATQLRQLWADFARDGRFPDRRLAHLITIRKLHSRATK
ncbi:carboxylesterase family protein [Nesterenkonia muleiensis]|uniref:carboxylesterase family protein n=1 Tax=Nesterenkonia muleiensis TaxID=2282648 RepID=UPI000E72C68D|nr:carboxylesterase family protein [Nesterenkonia muleiensis]